MDQSDAVKIKSEANSDASKAAGTPINTPVIAFYIIRYELLFLLAEIECH